RNARRRSRSRSSSSARSQSPTGAAETPQTTRSRDRAPGAAARRGGGGSSRHTGGRVPASSRERRATSPSATMGGVSSDTGGLAFGKWTAIDDETLTNCVAGPGFLQGPKLIGTKLRTLGEVLEELSRFEENFKNKKLSKKNKTIAFITASAPDSTPAAAGPPSATLVSSKSLIAKLVARMRGLAQLEVAVRDAIRGAEYFVVNFSASNKKRGEYNRLRHTISAALDRRAEFLNGFSAEKVTEVVSTRPVQIINARGASSKKKKPASRSTGASAVNSQIVDLFNRLIRPALKTQHGMTELARIPVASQLIDAKNEVQARLSTLSRNLRRFGVFWEDL
ncbi:unnamed protein product, partial [Amoebophrya sp. A120]